MAKRKKTRRFQNGGGIEPTRQDSINTNIVQSMLGGPYERKLRMIFSTASADNPELYDSKLEELFASRKKVGTLTPEEMARVDTWKKGVDYKKGGMIGKSKGNRDQFTQQYD